MGKGNRPTTFTSLLVNNVNLQIGRLVSQPVQLTPGLSFVRLECDITNHTDPASFFELECDISYDGGVSWPDANKVANAFCQFKACGRQGGPPLLDDLGQPILVMSGEMDFRDPVTGQPRQADANTFGRLVSTLTVARLRTSGWIYGG